VFGSLRTQQLRYQNPDWTYPVIGGMMGVVDEYGTVEPIVDLSVNSVSLAGPTGPGVLVYDGSGLLLNGQVVGTSLPAFVTESGGGVTLALSYTGDTPANLTGYWAVGLRTVTCIQVPPKCELTLYYDSGASSIVTSNTTDLYLSTADGLPQTRFFQQYRLKSV